MYFSHPDRPLQDHIQDVLHRLHCFLDEVMLLAEIVPWDHSLDDIVLGHDFGKYTTFFQRKLKREPVGHESRHAELGALIASFAAEQRLSSHWKSTDWSYYLPLFIYFIIWRHHGHLRNIGDIQNRWSGADQNDRAILLNQIEDLQIHREAISSDSDSYVPRLAAVLPLFLERWEEHFLLLEKKTRMFERKMKLRLTEKDLSAGVALQQWFSLLIDADKHSAAMNPMFPRSAIHADCVEKYRCDEFGTDRSSGKPINEQRERVRLIVMQQIEQLDITQSFLSFTAPTGAGKTLTALEAALRLRERLSENGGAYRRIVYVLPFTSIIDQNYDVLEKVICPEGTDHRLILKHHYLSEVEYEVPSHQEWEASLDKKLMFVESWDSEVIVTTYVQWLHTMLAAKNRQLKKLHHMAGAIAILDEVQNIPYKYWKLTRELCRTYSNHFDNKWILLTATQPHIFPEHEKTELLQQPDTPNEVFFRDLRRTLMQLVSDHYLEWEAWEQEIQQLVHDRQTVLIIANTISSSRRLFKSLEEQYKDSVFYLSANLVPVHRRAILRIIRQRLKDRKHTILVSTQVVEAGVDLDFQCVIRDLGPIDAMIQAAGRCNRNGGPDTGHVYIVPLRKTSTVDPDGVMVYGTDVVEAFEVLKQAQNIYPDGIPESYYKSMVDQYYERVSRKGDDSASTIRLEQLAKLSFESLQDFSLIDNKVSKHPVFVQYDEDAVTLWEQYVNGVIQEKDPESKRDNYLRIKSLLKEYQMDISIKSLRKHARLEPVYGYIIIRHEYLTQYYHPQTGFIIDPQDAGAFLW